MQSVRKLPGHYGQDLLEMANSLADEATRNLGHGRAALK